MSDDWDIMAGYRAAMADPEFVKMVQDQKAQDHAKRLTYGRRAGKKYRATHPDLVKRRNALYHSDIKTRLFHKQKGICKWCGNRLDAKCELDHIVSMVKGGTDDFENLCVCHSRCNKEKGVK